MIIWQEIHNNSLYKVECPMTGRTVPLSACAACEFGNITFRHLSIKEIDCSKYEPTKKSSLSLSMEFYNELKTWLESEVPPAEGWTREIGAAPRSEIHLYFKDKYDSIDGKLTHLVAQGYLESENRGTTRNVKRWYKIK